MLLFVGILMISGCQPVVERKTVIIKQEPNKNAPSINLQIGKPTNPQCTRDHHCGHCDVCRRNGWTHRN